MMLVHNIAQLESCYCCVCDKLATFFIEHFKSKNIWFDVFFVFQKESAAQQELKVMLMLMIN